MFVRAEAAALIVRARGINEASPKNNFVDIIKPELLERIFNSLKLFNDISYEPDRTITNGEMARAAIRLGSEEHTLTYMNLSALTTFEHMYAKDIYYLGNGFKCEIILMQNLPKQRSNYERYNSCINIQYCS